MIDTLTGNSWNVFFFFYNNHLIHRWCIIYILFYTLLYWWFVCFVFYLFLLNTYTFTYMKAFVIISCSLSVCRLKPASRCQRVLQVPSYLVHVKSNSNVWNNKILNTMDMLKWFKVQNQLLFNILPWYSYCNKAIW